MLSDKFRQFSYAIWDENISFPSSVNFVYSPVISSSVHTLRRSAVAIESPNATVFTIPFLAGSHCWLAHTTVSTLTAEIPVHL